MTPLGKDDEKTISELLSAITSVALAAALKQTESELKSLVEVFDASAQADENGMEGYFHNFVGLDDDATYAMLALNEDVRQMLARVQQVLPAVEATMYAKKDAIVKLRRDGKL
jgi:phage-related minor tail protein